MMTWRMRMMRKEQERDEKEEQSRAWRQGKGLIRRQAPLSPHLEDENDERTLRRIREG